jgi:hypothetical protein
MEPGVQRGAPAGNAANQVFLILRLQGGAICLAAFCLGPCNRSLIKMTTGPSAAVRQDRTPAKARLMSTIASALCFAVWTIFSIVGLRLEDELSETELGRVASCCTF